jgi:hypothetical protein
MPRPPGPDHGSDSRREFLKHSLAGSAVLAAGAHAGAQDAAVEPAITPHRPIELSSLAEDVRALVEATPFVDTHEHLMEEKVRLEQAAEGPDGKSPAPDFVWYFTQYAQSDLMVAGMPGDDFNFCTGRGPSPQEKWRKIEPWYERTWNTGYLMAARESLRLLHDEEDFAERNVEKISEQFADRIKPGYYDDVLRNVSKIEHTQVNALDVPVFRSTQYPDLLAQDMSFVPLSTSLNIAAVSALADREVKGLADWHGVIDWCFDTFGPRAVAIKNQSAYGRRLDYAQVSTEEATPLFERLLQDPKQLSPEEHKAIQDHLFHYCIRKAVEYDLPVKLHTGYYAGHNSMPLHRLRNNAGDMADLLIAHPDAKFVIMHITWPYQDEAISLAKHFSNAWVDMCWAWIINPEASKRFVKEFLMAAPVNKLFTFGGDYLAVENVPGHAAIARKGLAECVTQLVQERWLPLDRTEALVDRLMRGNAHEVFPYARACKAWNEA